MRTEDYDKPTEILSKWLDAAEEFSQYERGFLRFVDRTIDDTERLVAHYPKAFDPAGMDQFEQLKTRRADLLSSTKGKNKKRRRGQVHIASLTDQGVSRPGGMEVLPLRILFIQHAHDLMHVARKFEIVTDQEIPARMRRFCISIQRRQEALPRR